MSDEQLIVVPCSDVAFSSIWDGAESGALWIPEKNRVLKTKN